MFAQFLIPKTSLDAAGVGPSFDLGLQQVGLLQLTLVIEKTVEQQSLDVWLEGSADGEQWQEKPVAAFPQKFYTGASVLVCDWAAQGELKFVRARWRPNRWGRGSLKPHFEVYLFGETITSHALDSK